MRSDFAIPSICSADKMVEPVVVNPETVSKSALIKLGIARENTKGKHPKILMTIHASATVINPSLA